MNREALDKLCERGILGLVLAILVFGPLAMGAVDTPAFLVIQTLTLGVMLLWTLRIWASPRAQLLWPPVCWVVLAFTIYAIARYLTADIEYVARQEMIQVLMYAFLFFAIVNNLYRQEVAQIIGFTLIFLAMAHFRLRGLSIFHALEPRLEFHLALSGARVGHLHFAEQPGRLSRNAAAAGDRLCSGRADETGHADFSRLRGAGHGGGAGGDVFARRLGGGGRRFAGGAWHFDRPSQSPDSGVVAAGGFHRRRRVFHQELSGEDARLTSRAWKGR